MGKPGHAATRPILLERRLQDRHDNGGIATNPHNRMFYGWTIVGVSFLAQNFAIGITFGAYSPLLQALEQRFDTSRGLAASGLSMVSLTLGLIAPVIGTMLQRYSARTIMLAGAVLMTIGFALIAFVTSIFALLTIYALMIGVGAVCLSTVPGTTLVTRWFERRRGMALGIVNTLPGMFLFPLLASAMLLNFGFEAVFLVQAALMAMLIPVLLLIVDHPRDKGLAPLGAAPEDRADSAHAASAAGSTAAPAEDGQLPLGNPLFWYLSLGIAMWTGVSSMISIHLIPLLSDIGIPLAQAAMVYSGYGLAVTAGAPLAGAIVDRAGPLKSLVVFIALGTAAWIGFLAMPPGLAAYTTLSVVVGLAAGGIVTLHTSSAALLFSQAAYPKVIGTGYLIKMPFLFAAGPAGGFIHDATGSYNLAILGALGTMALAGVLFILLNLLRRPAASVSAA